MEQADTQIGTVEARHFHVGENQIDRSWVPMGKLQCFIPVGGRKNGVPFALQKNRHEIANEDFIVSYENDDLVFAQNGEVHERAEFLCRHFQSLSADPQARGVRQWAAG